VGGLFIVGTVAGVLSVVFQQPVVGADDYLTEVSLNADRVATGSLLVLVMGVALVGVAIAMYPVLKQHSERFALGYVVARSIESLFAVIDTILVLTLLTVSREFVTAGSPDASHFQILGELLLAGRDWVNAAILPATAFGLSIFILNYALYRARLVPRWLSVWGLVSGVPYLASGVMVMYGLEPFATTQSVLMAPLGLQEMVLAVWLLVRGFNAAAFASDPEREPVLT
jgi:hypothetical protein